ncbi:hypothetical protein [Massilia sp. ZL223]|uniref:hypothetical protein n=1 Tax=Massilia sp. ZL223 TaxID=2824904 RepID=UPI001B827B39|nr:hypothetical protein [Massilia sp. ZL223]MBQ5963177.1 hypothetical protein [Massilia sp. ZL223]
MPTNANHEQPKPTGRLLTSYMHHGLKLDLYGELDEDGYEVNDITLAGSKVSLFELVSADFLESLSLTLDLTQPSAAQLRRQSCAEQRAEIAAWDREAA